MAYTKLQASLLVSDDPMNASITRNDLPCRYRVEGVGLMIVNDAHIFECAIPQIVRQHFPKELFYVCGFPFEKKNESDPDYYKLAFDIILPLGEYSRSRTAASTFP